MNSTKNLILALLLLLAAGISSNLTAQEKKVHVKVITNGKTADTVYTVTSMSGSGSSGNEQEEEMEEGEESFPLMYTINSPDHICCMKDSCRKKCRKMHIQYQVSDTLHKGGKHHRMKYVIRRSGRPRYNIDSEMEMIPFSHSKDTMITHISAKGDTIKIHRKVLKDGKIQQEVTVNKHSKDSAEHNYFKYKVRPGRNHMIYRNMRAHFGDDENFAFTMPPMPAGWDKMNFAFPGIPKGIDENTDFGKIKVTPLSGKNLIRVSLDLSGKEYTVIKINDEKGKAVFEEKIKDLTGKYVRDIDMTGYEKGNYSLSIERGKSAITKQFTYYHKL